MTEHQYILEIMTIEVFIGDQVETARYQPIPNSTTFYDRSMKLEERQLLFLEPLFITINQQTWSLGRRVMVAPKPLSLPSG